MAKAYRFHKWGSLWWSDGLPVYIGGKEITPHGWVWWFPWNWVLFVALLLITAVMVPYRKLRGVVK